MVDKWCDNPNCDWAYESNEHRRILAQRIRSACRVSAGISAFVIFGLIGSAELSRITMAQFAILELIAVAILLISIKFIIDNKDA